MRDPLRDHLPGPGTRIGAYEVVRELARGGMGAVYAARDALGLQDWGEAPTDASGRALPAVRPRVPGALQVWDLARGQLVGEVLDWLDLLGCDVSPDGRWLLVGLEGRQAELWPLAALRGSQTHEEWRRDPALRGEGP